MESDLTKYIANFDKNNISAKSAIMPLLSHAVLNAISAKKVHTYITEGGYKVSLVSIQRWKREAAKWLGLTQHKPGRISKSELELQHAKWHKKYGYPTLQDFINGWKPGAETGAIIESNLEEKIEENTPSKTGSKTATPAPQKKRNNFSKLAAEIEPVKAGSATQSTDEILESIKRPIKETN